MKKHNLFAIILISATALFTACSHTSRYNSQVDCNTLNESWISRINLNPMIWTRNADRWFFTGQPTQTEQAANKAPNESAMTIMAVKVPQFTSVSVDGYFQVQISGDQEHNSVFVLGPNDAVRQTSVQVSGNTVYVSQIVDQPTRISDLRNVIVRINVHHLQNLKVAGNAMVEGRNIRSKGLVIESSNACETLLNGAMRLLKVTNTGPGSVAVLGVFTPTLDINDWGNGDVKVAGRIGIRSIQHDGRGMVSVIGADSNALTIDATGGITTIAGYANLKKLTAVNYAGVFMYWVNSNGACITERDSARVGLAGSATSLDIDLADNARLEGQYLRGDHVYIRTSGNSHGNITVLSKLFASARDNSSIYYFGSPATSITTSGNGNVVPVFGGDTILPVPPASTFIMMRGPTIHK